MWLDRFSHQSTPSGTPPPQARPYSPAPSRRPYLTPGTLPVRPGLSPRSSSLSLVSANVSTASLPSTVRIPNGSGLRQQIARTPPSGIQDPSKVLEDIFGKPPRKGYQDDSSDKKVETEKPSELVEDIDFDGLSLEAFAERQDTQSRVTAIVHNYSAQSVEEFDKENDKFEDLHRSILACDDVLKSVETYLTGFQADLGAVSAEIETLQSRSTTLNTKLENRKVVEKLLGPAVEDITISPAVVQKISEGPIDAAWNKALAELEKRSKAIDARLKEPNVIQAVRDLKPLLDDLTNKAIERIRDYLVAQIKALRSPNINAQILQQQNFLAHKDLSAFLSRHHPQLADEIRQAYINTMRWYYLHHFTRYRQALEKLKLYPVDAHWVLAADESSVKQRSSAKSTTTGPFDPFSLGRRMDILRSNKNSALPSHLAEDDKSAHFLETPFHSFNLALLHNCTFEHTFLSTFFSGTHATTSRAFDVIFAPTLSLAHSLTKALLDSTYDALGLLIAVRLNQRVAFALQRAKIPCLDGYVNGTAMLLWPRFQQVMSAHTDSTRKFTAALSSRPPASSLLSSSSSAAAAQSTAPHPLTQRFSNFAHGILALSAEAGDEEPVGMSLDRLRTEFENALLKLSKGIAGKNKPERFLANNYSLVGTILEGVEGPRAERMRARFRELREGVEGG
ncbi:Sac2 family protein [Patellaria atrata CBS 101060]|uniref:Sac2 family protein n=1 Tax=Patellaria atrata CBS 101060 TaxID=1346257 RepID=A0A9P4VPY3_9PEZI|nr:Sac2 family protein [Patellaria atrata CBS 101060]